MAKQNRTILKGYFETGDTPSQAQYADLIDSNLNLSEADSISVTHITASGDISASGNIFGHTGSFDYLESDKIVGHKGDANTGLQFASNTVILEADDIVIGKFASTLINLNKSISSTLTEDVVIDDSLKVNQELNVLSHITSSGNISASIGTGSFGSLVVDGSSVDFSGLPTSDPGVAGRLYNDSGTIKISL